ncbi:hypothetical protein [Noviherbaspirillum sp. Root189]|uniref:hypothetical protein n=1 Tax=Noviherbaspirillum sp. Root189 TaxID=1736487 RepID=UPI000710CC60|nr:hypothetical protein [Noviherbaspirillum sp. Root189]KRB91435.1 hypothetical protein ASE07_16390 [Noviherbaspirillum sp. Root189]
MKTKSLTLSLIAAATIAGFGVAPAMAQHSNTPGIDNAQQDIHARIQQGMASGQITRDEARDLFQREREIQIREARMKNDGRATQHERRQLRVDLDNLRAEVEGKIANGRFANRRANGAPAIDNAQAQIRMRLEQGVRSGQIDRREGEILAAKERMLRRHEAAFSSDGVISGRERQQLREEVALLNQDIDRMMSNRRGY